MFSPFGKQFSTALRVVSLGMAVLGVAQAASLPTFESAAALERFVLSSNDDEIKTALETALTLEGAGSMIQLAAKMGPAYATKIANLLPDPGFREGYSGVARYLDLFGPCQKKNAGAAEGWWSNYPDPPSDVYCSEVAKLLYSALLWNQVHYCGRLASGEEKPKTEVPGGKKPPYRLDEPPVATHWLNASALYAITDAAFRFDFAKLARTHAETSPERVAAALSATASALEHTPANRESAAIAIAKLLLRRYEQTHLDHLAKAAESSKQAPENKRTN